MKRSELFKLRELIERASAMLPDEEAAEGPALFRRWAVGVDYAVDDRICYGEKLYKVVQAHKSQEDWTPDVNPALFVEVAKPGEIPVWVQPTGAQDAYNTGDMVHYPDADSPVYESLIDNNVWSPEAYPTGWELKGE